jgi:tight adherence protein B
MNWGLIIAVLTAAAVVTTILALWSRSETRRGVRERVAYRPRVTDQDAAIFRDPVDADPRWKSVAILMEQAGYNNSRVGLFIIITVACAMIGGVGAWRHTGGILLGLAAALMGSSLPYLYLLRKRHQRFQQFEQQFPDALDMMTRSIRAGHALSGAIGLVGEEMPGPVGEEFRRVFEEIRLGVDPGEALVGIQQRVPTEDTSFFYTALSIQRLGGGNLAEILDRLAEVIRERFKVLKHARVLSTQHRWTAICVGLSPFVFALIFGLTYPGYFDPVLQSPHAPYMLAAGLILEAVGFFAIWRIAQIEV